MSTQLDDAQAERLRDQLLKRLHAQRQRTFNCLGWYMGDQTPPGLPRDATGQVYRRIRETSRNTWAALIVDSIAERLELQGYRSGDGDRALEQLVWQLFQANRVDDEQWQVHVDSLLAGRGYVMVAPPDPDDPDADEVPVVITPESPLEVVHLWQPGKRGGRRFVRAALKAFEDGTGLWRAELYTPAEVWAWEVDAGDDAERQPFLPAIDATKRTPWQLADDVQVNELGAVPVVPFENRRTTSTGPLSEVLQVEHVLERIDELLVGRQVAAYFAAFRQKWATGLEVPRDPETNQPIAPYKAAVSQLWIAEDGEARFGQFEATELGQYTRTIEAEVGELAAVSKVPAHYFLQSELANPPSADSLTAGEAGLVKKCRARQRSLGEAWEQVARLAVRIAEPQKRLGRSDELVWADPRVLSPAQLADYATKAKQAGVPDEALWETLGATPQTIERWRTMRAEQDLREAALGLTAPTPTPAPLPVPAAV